jgi:Translocation protein Sec62
VLIKTVNQAVKLLLGAKYRKACKRCAILPEVLDAVQAVEFLQALQCSELLAKVETKVPSDGSRYRRILRINDEKPKVLSLVMEDDHFFWLEQAKRPLIRWAAPLSPILLLVGLYQFRKSLGNLPWRIIFRHRDTYYNIRFALSFVSMLDIALWLFVTPLIVVLVRVVLFMITHFGCSRGLWLFPNLISDSTFLGPFSPLYAWDTAPKESLGLRWRKFRNSMLVELGMLKQRRKNRVKRMRRKLHKAW